MSAGQLVIVTNEASGEKYGTIVQVMTASEYGEDSYVVLVGSELLILTGADIAAI
jgi:hypothetical protein